MYLQPVRPANPYDAYHAMIQKRGLLGDRAKALAEPVLRLDQLSATSIKTQMLAHAVRYDHLGSALSGLLPALADLANPDHLTTVRMVAKVQVAKVQTSQPSLAERDRPTPATLIAATPLTLNGGTAGTTATMTSDAPVLRTGPEVPATAATLTLGKVSLNTTQSTKAELRGDIIALPQHASEADFGALTINGVTTTLGIFAGNDERLAAQFIVDRLNANQANTVDASVDKSGKRVTLSAKVPGTAGNIHIDRPTPDSDGRASNDASAGFQAGDRADGKDGGSTDFGSVTINGVTTRFGVRDNKLQTPQTAAQWLVDRLNANSLNDFTATVGGADRDQIVLTSKALGRKGQLSIDRVAADSDGNAGNDGSSGFVAGGFAAGQDADAGSTDFGSVTIAGVTTSFGSLSNAGLTTQGAARFMVERLNANGSNLVAASLGGADLDRVVLTAKTLGRAGSFRIEQTTSDHNGWVAGRAATGQDATAPVTDFGSITINGITTQLGVVDGRQHTAQSALQYLLDRLNQTNPTITARALNGAIALSSKDTGSLAGLTIDAITPGSDGDARNDRGLGFVPGQSAVGKDDRPASAPAPAPAIETVDETVHETVYETIVDRDQVSRRVGQAGQIVQSLNRYLQTLEGDQQWLPSSVQGFRAELNRSLHEEEKTFATLGIHLQGDRLEFDAGTLETALMEDPSATVDHFKRLHQTLEANVGAQAFALDQMRATAQTTSEMASTISHVSASLYKVQHRAKKLDWILERMAAADASLRDQRERLQKLADDRQVEREPVRPEWEPQWPAWR